MIIVSNDYNNGQDDYENKFICSRIKLRKLRITKIIRRGSYLIWCMRKYEKKKKINNKCKGWMNHRSTPLQPDMTLHSRLKQLYIQGWIPHFRLGNFYQEYREGFEVATTIRRTDEKKKEVCFGWTNFFVVKNQWRKVKTNCV